MSDYKRLDELGIPVYWDAVPHVKVKEVTAALAKNDMSEQEFNEMFGVQTCPIVGGDAALYPWDTEAVIERMISGRLTGTQRHWD
jgi:hypothetical protein